MHRNEAMPPVVAVSAHVISNVHLNLKKLTSANTARYASTTCFCKQHPRAANISNKQRGRRVIYTSHRNNKLQAPHQATVSEQKKKKVVKAGKEKATHTINNKKRYSQHSFILFLPISSTKVFLLILLLFKGGQALLTVREHMGKHTHTYKEKKQVHK